LFRLRYGGSAHSFGFAVYSHASERYQDAVLLTGRHTGTPQEALDTACTLYPRRPRARTRTPTPDELTGPPTKEEYADFGNGIWGVLKMARPAGGFHLKSDGGTTVKYLNDRWAQHGGQLPWR
jgi:hypothetical protein